MRFGQANLYVKLFLWANTAWADTTVRSYYLKGGPEMPFSRDAIEYIAHLARLDIKETEDINSIQADLNKIVAMVNQITAANTDGIQPMAHPLEMVQRLRPDAVTEPNDRETLLALAPVSESGLFLVPTVLEDA